MRWLSCFLCGFLLTVSGFCNDTKPPKPIPEKQIRIPFFAPLPQPPQPQPGPPHDEPKPSPGPRPVDTLGASEWYVIQSEIPFFVVDSPPGIVRVQTESGPLKLRGSFADSSKRGTIETRTYNAPHLVTVEAVTPGTVELIVVPAGATDAAACLRATLQVMGAGPRPGPEPGPDPKPEPEPEPKPVASKLSIAVIEDTLNRSADTAIVLSALDVWNGFRDAGHVWYFYDQKTGEARGKRAKQDAGQTPLPAIVIRDAGAADKVLHVGPLPKTVAELQTLIKSLTGK